MGGCRCSYRSCSAKSDGKIHMFHYPVFDKIRCHQWLTNAHKLEFLDLKVSQLKNRVVCQHHFLPHHFMNFKMDKLTFYAVPTENGPFCDPDDDDDMPTVTKATIDPEEIDIEPLSTKDKVASLKVKFAQFLCSSDLDVVEPNEEVQSLMIKDVKCNFGSKDESTFKFPYKVPRCSGEDVKKQQPQPMLVVPPFSDSTHQICVHKPRSNVRDMESERNTQPVARTDCSKKVKIISEKKITSPVPVKGKLEPVSPSLIIKPRGRPNDFIPITQNTINIESDKLLQDNLLLYGNTSGLTQNAEQVPFDTQLLEAQANHCTFVVSPIDKNFETHLCKPSQVVDSQPQAISVMNEEINTNVNERILLQLEDFNNYTQNKKLSIPPSPNVSHLKTKIPPERIAEIEEKRNFNKKLRDMIEFCLDELDCPEKPTENSLQKKNITRQPIVKVEKVQTEPEKVFKVGHTELQRKDTRLKTKLQNQADSEEKVASHLSVEKRLSSTGQFAMAVLEERLNKMEETLLRKIDQNSQRILDLKSTIESTSTIPAQKASVICQTKNDMDIYKKQLFKEISQFLGPQLKSLIYEEMFLNKFAKVSTNATAFKNVEEKDEFVEVDVECESPKRRRRRRRI